MIFLPEYLEEALERYKDEIRQETAKAVTANASGFFLGTDGVINFVADYDLKDDEPRYECSITIQDLVKDALKGNEGETDPEYIEELKRLLIAIEQSAEIIKDRLKT